MVLGLNGIQNGPGPFNGFVATLDAAKAAFTAGKPVGAALRWGGYQGKLS
jgi:hypothetical protein